VKEEGRRKKEEGRKPFDASLKVGNYKLAKSQTTKIAMASQKQSQQSPIKLSAEDIHKTGRVRRLRPYNLGLNLHKHPYK